jgi:long-chain acyl-CoA synthetase
MEQCMFSYSMLVGAKIGYFQGNPLKLVADCAELCPTVFPSVPRLYNKIYGIIKGKFDEATGCKAWLINKAVDSKMAYLDGDAGVAYTHGCYDKLVFSKL